MKVAVFRSLLAQYLPSRLYGNSTRLTRWLWRLLYRYYLAGRLPVRVRLHGRTLILNPGNPYPFILADAPDFNSGLVAAAASLREYLGRRLRVVDVGAAIGDTVVLLDYSIAQCMESCVCVDGALDNKAFFEKNTKGIQGISTYFTMLSAKGDEVSSLVRQHAGTAMAAGLERMESQTLDALLARCGLAGKCDLLKIDVDGFDGEVLLGASRTLENEQPLVIFEWHPQLIQQCGKDHRAPFLALNNAGYRKLLWFGNRGPFSHASAIPGLKEIDWWRDFLIDKNKPFGPHFDVVAVPLRFESLIDPIAKASVYPH